MRAMIKVYLIYDLNGKTTEARVFFILHVVLIIIYYSVFLLEKSYNEMIL